MCASMKDAAYFEDGWLVSHEARWSSIVQKHYARTMNIRPVLNSAHEVVVRMIMVFRLFLQGRSFAKAKTNADFIHV